MTTFKVTFQAKLYISYLYIIFHTLAAKKISVESRIGLIKTLGLNKLFWFPLSGLWGAAMGSDLLGTMLMGKALAVTVSHHSAPSTRLKCYITGQYL